MTHNMSDPRSSASLTGLPKPQPGIQPNVPANVLGQAPSSETLAKWFEALAGLQRSAGGSPSFFADAAAAVCDPGGLDAGFVISVVDPEGAPTAKAESRWRIDASYFIDTVTDIDLEPSILRQVRTDGRTLYHDANKCDKDVTEFAIASPIFDRDEKVVGVVYGVRSTNSGNQRHGVRPLEALWVQLVAEAVTGAVIRGELESDLIRSRVMFESAFAPSIVQQLLRNQTALTASQRELTILFADLRGFTRMSEHLGPSETYHLLSDVMNQFTEQVMLHGGVIIDYYGDGMAAMWNAPADQPDHALMACAAAIALREQLTVLNSRWSSQLSEPLRIGVGLNTGTAMVGNAGSDRHLKYGPRGPAVNLTSRIESATKQLGVTIVMSEEVQKRVHSHMITRRLCKARLSGIDEPVVLFELVDRQDVTLERSVVEKLWRYEEALRAFENADLELAEDILCDAMISDDAPAKLLIDAITESHQPDAAFDAVFDLTSPTKP